MSDSSRRASRLWTTALCIAIALCAYFLLFDRGNSGERAAQALRARVEQYAALRCADDWVGLYELADPKHRAKVSRNDFLRFYGHGILKTHAVNLVRSDVTPQGTAKVTVRTDGELIVERLPEQYRRGLKIEDKSATRQSAESEIDWVLRDGTWYFEMDRQCLVGKDSQGRTIQPVPPVNR